MINRERRGNSHIHRSISISKMRTVFLFDEIDNETSQEFIEDLILLDGDKKKRPITIYLSSPGGWCDKGLGMADIIEKLRCPTRCIALGDICSMAPVVFVACDERIIAKHAFVMLHPIAGGGSDYLEFIRARMKNIEQVEKQYEEYFLSKTSLPRKLYRKSRNTELWLTAEEAVKYGIAHKIM